MASTSGEEAMTPELLERRVRALVENARARAANGLTIAEFGSLTVEVLRLAVRWLESIPAEGAAKKAWALSSVALAFDSLADLCIPLPAKPVWWIFRPAVRALVLSAASGALEQVLALVRAVEGKEFTPAYPVPEAKS